jgi:hypothetical protein
LLTIGCGGWPPTNIVLQSLFLVGPSTDKAPVVTLRPQMNSSTLLSLGLEIQIRDSEQRGRRERGWRSSSQIVEPYWFWMAWSRCKTHLGRKRVDCVSLRFKHSCASSLLSIPGFA